MENSVANETKVRQLYKNLLDSWNSNDANRFADCFAENGNTIGFDGSQMNGRENIRKEISEIFATHTVSSYVSIVREVRALTGDIFVLRANTGMVPPGKSEIKPDVNAVQALVAQKEGDEFRIALFQNTPAAFHGRPELAKQLTEELTAVLQSQQK